VSALEEFEAATHEEESLPTPTEVRAFRAPGVDTRPEGDEAYGGEPVRLWRRVARIDGLQVVYHDSAVDPSDVQDGLVVVNVHGFFAGGAMYRRESAAIARQLRCRVINPSLPGFGGSSPMPLSRLSMEGFAHLLLDLLDSLRVNRALWMGHSMGGAVAVSVASLRPDRVLGLVYRDGAATPSWKMRDGLLARFLHPISGDLGALLDLAGGAMVDVPDLVAGRITATIRRALPELGENVRTLVKTLPVAAMLYETDLSEAVQKVSREVPFLLEWGAFDYITPAKTASEVEQLTGSKVLWVLGGHSWMLARPETQVQILRYHPRGREFLAEALGRKRDLEEFYGF
jgi:pimeloyl-ACP methyl ester carboxylesterase